MIEWILAPIVIVMVGYLVRHYFFTFQAIFGKPRQLSYLQIAGAYLPKVSILIPAHNEENVIGNLLQRMTELTYPKELLEVVAIDDASTDRTGEIADGYAVRYPYIKAIHRAENGGFGKVEALNCGYNFSNGEIVLTFDADYFPQRDIVEKLVAPFADPEVGAVQGRVTVVNEEDSIVSKIVALERIGGYRVDQLARDDLALLPQYGGTVGGFRRAVLQEVGGWGNSNSPLAEDTDLTCRAALQGYKVRYMNDAECYEEAVSGWREYWNQRYRWARGHMQCAISYLGRFLRSDRIGFWGKIEMTLLLGVYFVPVITLLGWITGVGVYILGAPGVLPYYFALLGAATYTSIGNFAPFFEIGMGTYLDERPRLAWLLPAVIIAFGVNVFCCAKALADLAVTRIGRRLEYRWVKTTHRGNNFNNYRNHFNNWNNSHNNNHNNHGRRNNNHLNRRNHNHRNGYWYNGVNGINGNNGHHYVARRYGEVRE
ncbi:MAG: glycosyltransferase [Candidatus Bathyarchaeia archaeon]